MTSTDASLSKLADKDLAKEATLTSIIFLLAWIIVVYTTVVADELPLVSAVGIGLFVLLVVVRLVLGLGFDSLYVRLTPRRWLQAFGATVLVNGATWGSLNAVVLWYYFPGWPAYLSMLCTAGLAAGGVNSLNTHLRLLQGFLMCALLPGAVALLLKGGTDNYTFAGVILLYCVFILGISSQLNKRYWGALRTSRQLEVALHRAEEASRAKSQFLANMSHEIRTPLNAVLGLAQLGTRSNHDKEARARFGHILYSGRHLLGIIDDILDMSKLDAGKLRLEAVPYELRAAVEEAIGMVHELALGKGLDLTVEFEPGLPAWVTGDPHRLTQILINLLGNAVKFTRQGDIRLVVRPLDGEISFSVIDTGIGVDESQIARLFDVFEQADGSTTRHDGGAGLGLAISKDLARMMGGRITAEGVPGKGSTFTLFLPLVETKAAGVTADEVRIAGDRLAGMNVLAVEDNRLNRMVLRQMLEHEGARVVLARDGRQALDRLVEMGSGVFGVVLMDIQMPVMDGYEATRRIHEIAPDLPVIGLTAHALDEERERCLAAGMVAHVSKPVYVDDLVAALLQHRTPVAASEATPRSGTPREKPVHATDVPGQGSLPGIDTDDALGRLKCDWPAFREILLDFYQRRRHCSHELEQIMQRGALEEAGALAHDIRGSSGYLGARELHRESAALEEACRSGDMERARAQVTRFCRSLDEVIEGLASLDGQISG
jgi:signal transduction histidine kinase/ActR/RegA family two-component response regulator/HPt (histidine-containing phosphotransfer) domain-containing protein